MIPPSTRRRLATSGVALLLALIAVLVLRREPDRPRGPPADGAVASSAPHGAAPELLPGPIPGRAGPKFRAPETPTAATSSPVVEPVPGLVVRGRVRTSEGVGVKGIQVELRAWSGSKSRPTWSNRERKTGVGGAYEFSIERAVASAGLGVVVSADGYLEAWRALDPKDYDGAQSIDVDVEIEAARSIACRVLDAGARPIPGAGAMLWYGSDSTWPTPADREGRILTPARAPHRAFTLIVEAPGYPRREVPVAASTLDRTDVGDVVFRRGGVVAGVVVDTHGEPVEDLKLVILNLASAGKDSAPRAKTDSRGRFEFPDLGLGTGFIGADEPDNLGGPPGRRRTYRGGIGGIEVGRRDVRIVCDTECVLLLRFVDAATGEPVDVHEAEYGARYEGTPVPEHLGAGGGASDPFRTARVTVASGRRYDVAVRSPGFELGRADGLDVRDLEEMAVDVRLSRSK